MQTGSWLGGVCAGIASVIGCRTAWVRAAFVVAAMFGGLGVAFYVVCWLILPGPDETPGEAGPRGIVVLARVCAGCVALAALGLAGAAGTVFGFGWAVLAVAAGVLVAVLSIRRLSVAWALLPVAALTLPGVAVAVAGLRLAPEFTAKVLAPADAAAVERSSFESGLGTMLIDLRHTRLPSGGTVPLRIRAGVRRTIVALPSGRCVRVVVHYRVRPFAAQLASLFTGHQTPSGDAAAPFSNLVLFGRLFDTSSPDVAFGPSARPGPVLAIDFRSQGGSLYVRDYPDAVTPAVDPDWPGYLGMVEPRPDVRGLKPRLARLELRWWRGRHAVELADRRRIDRLLPGPCAAAIAPVGRKRR